MALQRMREERERLIQSLTETRQKLAEAGSAPGLVEFLDAALSGGELGGLRWAAEVFERVSFDASEAGEGGEFITLSLLPGSKRERVFARLRWDAPGTDTELSAWLALRLLFDDVEGIGKHVRAIESEGFADGGSRDALVELVLTLAAVRDEFTGCEIEAVHQVADMAGHVAAALCIALSEPEPRFGVLPERLTALRRSVSRALGDIRRGLLAAALEEPAVTWKPWADFEAGWTPNAQETLTAVKTVGMLGGDVNRLEVAVLDRGFVAVAVRAPRLVAVAA